MPLSKQPNTHRGKDNPFLEWWTRNDDAWLALRRERWRTVWRAVMGNVRQAAPRAKYFREYYLHGEMSDAVIEGYVPPALRLAMIPWRSAEECRQAAEAYISPQSRQLRNLYSVAFDGRLVEIEGLPVERFDDEGIVRLEIAGEAIFPETFTAADASSRDDTDEAYFQERGKGTSAKPHPFIRNYHSAATWFLAGETDRFDRRSLMNPSLHVLEYYLSSVRYLEETGQTLVDPESLDRFLVEVLFFEARHPDAAPEWATATFAERVRVRLEQPGVPTTLLSARDRLVDQPPEVVPVEPAPEPKPFRHLKFLNRSKHEYELRMSPDTDSWVQTIARFGTKKKRDLVLKLTGEPGRPCETEGLSADERAVYTAIEGLPTPYRAVRAGNDGVFFEWCDWYDHYFELKPLIDAVRALEPDLAFVSESLHYDGDERNSHELTHDGVRTIRRSNDPLWKSFTKLAG